MLAMVTGFSLEWRLALAGKPDRVADGPDISRVAIAQRDRMTLFQWTMKSGMQRLPIDFTGLAS
jgi:hypothetical protein